MVNPTQGPIGEGPERIAAAAGPSPGLSDVLGQLLRPLSPLLLLPLLLLPLLLLPLLLLAHHPVFSMCLASCFCTPKARKRLTPNSFFRVSSHLM
jgi:hypothetical protein